ncbi:MAG: hypothetical protein ABW215_14905 [Kibdelosporangium sp.]
MAPVSEAGPHLDPAPPVHSPAPDRRRSGLAAVAAVAGGAALITVHAALYGNWIMDDAAITFAYSRSLAEGNGPILQPGAPPVEGYSNPTWMALLALGRLVGLFDHGTLFGIPDYVFFPKALALLCVIGVLTFCYFGAKAVTNRPRLVTFAAGAALAANPSFVIWCFSGLENPFYALAVVAIAVTMVRAAVTDRLLTWQVAVSTGVWAALAALTRPDGAIYAGAYPILVLLFVTRAKFGASLRAGLLSVAAFLLPFGAYLLFRWFEFGRIVPNTAVAKAQPVPEFTDLGKVVEVIQYAGWMLVVLLVGCLAMVMARPSRLRTGMIAALVPLGLAVVAFCVLDADWMGEYRFATPIWVLTAFVGSVVVVEAMSAARIRGRVLLAAVLVLGAAFSVNQFYGQATAYTNAVKTPMCVVAERDGRTVNGMADVLGLRDGSVGVIDLGGMSLTSRLRVVDLAGLGNAQTADYLHDNDRPGLRDHIFNEVKPSFITFIGTWDTNLGFTGDPVFARDYEPVFHSQWAGPPAPMIVNSYNYVGYWVRKDLVPGPAKLQELKDYTTARVVPILEANRTAPRRTCGPVLERGQTG